MDALDFEDYIRVLDSEFPRNSNTQTIYLDHAGCTRASKRQLENIFEELTSEAFANLPNPHSSSSKVIFHISQLIYLISFICIQILSNRIDDTRKLVLGHFNMSEDEYTVIFTSGATGAIKLVADMFPWDLGGALCYTENIHTSLLGLREFSNTNLLIPSKSIHSNDEIIFNETKENKSERNQLDSKERINLFVYPGECNFSGCKCDFDNVEKVISHLCY